MDPGGLWLRGENPAVFSHIDWLEFHTAAKTIGGFFILI
jgi:hypothetical protein